MRRSCQEYGVTCRLSTMVTLFFRVKTLQASATGQNAENIWQLQRGSRGETEVRNGEKGRVRKDEKRDGGENLSIRICTRCARLGVRKPWETKVKRAWVMRVPFWANFQSCVWDGLGEDEDSGRSRRQCKDSRADMLCSAPGTESSPWIFCANAALCMCVCASAGRNDCKWLWVSNRGCWYIYLGIYPLHLLPVSME